MSASLPQTDSIEPSSAHRPVGSSARHAVEITDPADFDTAVDAAETLGLSLSDCYMKGHWEAHPSQDCGLSRNIEVEVEKAGRKWFHVQFDDGVVMRVRPSDLSDNGRLRLLFD